MKNVFDTNRQTKEKDGDCFKAQTLQGDLLSLKAEASEAYAAYKKKAFKPVKGLLLSSFFVMIAFMVVCGSAAMALRSKSMAEYAVIASIIVGGLIALLLLFLSVRKNKAILQSSAFIAETEKYGKIVEDALRFLEVPQEADWLDVFSYAYDIKKGKRHIGLFGRYYRNNAMAVFVRDECLCLADENGDAVYAIPLREAESIVRRKKRAVLMKWNKEESYRQGRYKAYKVKYNRGYYSVKAYSIQIVHAGEAYELIVPNYDLEILRTYVPLPVVESAV